MLFSTTKSVCVHTYLYFLGFIIFFMASVQPPNVFLYKQCMMHLIVKSMMLNQELMYKFLKKFWNSTLSDELNGTSHSVKLQIKKLKMDSQFK